MSSQNIYEGIGEVLHITTDSHTKCEACEQNFHQDDISGAINHYIKTHNYKLLHTGTETTLDGQGRIWHCTAALLGK